MGYSQAENEAEFEKRVQEDYEKNYGGDKGFDELIGKPNGKGGVYTEADRAASREQALANVRNNRKALEAGNGGGYEGPGEAQDNSKTFRNPGAADYGGRGGVDYYKGAGLAGMGRNDKDQAAMRAAMEGSLRNAMANRGPQANENAFLSQREADARNEQMGSLGLNMNAAMGRAPSEAAHNTSMGMNDIMAQTAGVNGSARGLAGLGGSQMMAASGAGGAAGQMAQAGGLARSKEIAEAMGLYGSQSGQARGQDLTRLGMANQMSDFNANLNDAWRIGNLNNATGQGKMGVAQGALDQAWYNEAMKPEMIQSVYDQDAAGLEAGAAVDKAALTHANDIEERTNRTQLIGGITQAGLTAVGSLAGPAGSAAGAGLGGAINSATRKF